MSDTPVKPDETEAEGLPGEDEYEFYDWEGSLVRRGYGGLDMPQVWTSKGRWRFSAVPGSLSLEPISEEDAATKAGDPKVLALPRPEWESDTAPEDSAKDKAEDKAEDKKGDTDGE